MSSKTMLTVCLIALAGCDAQAEPSYLGEPLATVHGTILNDSLTDLSAKAALLWFNPADNELTLVATEAPVVGEFPADFIMSVYEPPPAAALLPDAADGGFVTLGQIVALEPNANPSLYPDDLDQVLGVADQFVVAYTSYAGYALFTLNTARLDETEACNAEWVEAWGSCFQECPMCMDACDAACEGCVLDCMDPHSFDCEQFGDADDPNALWRPAPAGFDTEVAVRIGAEISIFAGYPDPEQFATVIPAACKSGP